MLYYHTPCTLDSPNWTLKYTRSYTVQCAGHIHSTLPVSDHDRCYVVSSSHSQSDYYLKGGQHRGRWDDEVCRTISWFMLIRDCSLFNSMLYCAVYPARRWLLCVCVRMAVGGWYGSGLPGGGGGELTCPQNCPFLLHDALPF